MATNERVINRSIRTTGHWFADPQNVYWLSSALSTNILPIANVSEVWIERNYTPSVIHVSVCRRLHGQTSYISLPQIN